MVVDEADGKARYDLVDRGGNIIASGVTLELASKTVRAGDDWGALEANLLLVKDDQGVPAPRTDNPHQVTAKQVGAYTTGQTDTLLAGKAPATHTHDDRYYTEGEVNAKLSGKADTAGTYPGLTVGHADTAGTLTDVLLPIQGGTGQQFQSLAFISRVVTTDANGCFVMDGLRGAIAAVGNIGSNEAADTKHCISFANPQQGRLVGNVFEASTGRSLPGFTCRVNIIYFSI